MDMWRYSNHGMWGFFPAEQDVANAVAYLLSDQADMINGTTLPIEGGLLVS